MERGWEGYLIMLLLLLYAISHAKNKSISLENESDVFQWFINQWKLKIQAANNPSGNQKEGIDML